MIRALVASLLVTSACAAPTAQGYGLTDAVRTYTEGVKWERFEAAAAVIPAAERDQFLDERDQLAKDLRITETEVLRMTQRARRAEVQVKLTWYRDAEGLVHESVAAQRWERRGKAWTLVDEHRARGDRMPGLRDLPERSAPAVAGPSVDVNTFEMAHPGEE